ncbi:MAG: 50S ribosomal protein L30 [Candidatus Nanoarchaeia archaeon]
MTARSRLAIIRIKGESNLSPEIRTALKNLKLYKKNYCSVWSNKPDIIGQFQKVKDWTTFGELDEKTFLLLLKNRGRVAGNKPLTEDYLKSKLNLSFEDFTKKYFAFEIELKDIPGLKLFFRLHPPKGGFERKGIKESYAAGGALGYRGKDINKLLARMI